MVATAAGLLVARRRGPGVPLGDVVGRAVVVGALVAVACGLLVAIAGDTYLRYVLPRCPTEEWQSQPAGRCFNSADAYQSGEGGVAGLAMLAALLGGITGAAIAARRVSRSIRRSVGALIAAFGGGVAVLLGIVLLVLGTN